MHLNNKITLILALIFCLAAPVQAASSGPVEINLTNPVNSGKLFVVIQREQSRAYQWSAGQIIQISASVNIEGQNKPVTDMDGRDSWQLRLDENAEGILSLAPSTRSVSGRLTIKGDGKILQAPTPYFGEYLGNTLEKVLVYKFPDGAQLKVRYTDEILAGNAEDPGFAKDVLDAAVLAYQTITQFKGFSAEGYSFAKPDTRYAYDPDRTIEILIGDTRPDGVAQMHGFSRDAFRDAPCFDTRKNGHASYDAVILIPANYKEFIRNWERLNPSPLGARNIEADLKGTLVHEMLHALVFYYNKNLNKEAVEKSAAGDEIAKKRIDWYVEGLARYFETLVGAKHDFYSQGFKQTLPGKIRFSRGGSNYYMRYPDQAFVDLRYENALFWKFIDDRFGMQAIERLSREFRDYENKSYRLALERVTGVSFNELLKDYSYAIISSRLGLKEDEAYLKTIARTQLKIGKDGFYLYEGKTGYRFLGKICDTDWIGSWDGITADTAAAPVAGDNTPVSDVSGWATDFIELTPDRGVLPDRLQITHKSGGYSLIAQIVVESRGGSLIRRELPEIYVADKKSFSIREIMNSQGLGIEDVRKLHVLLTNTDPLASSVYTLALE